MTCDLMVIFNFQSRPSRFFEEMCRLVLYLFLLSGTIISSTETNGTFSFMLHVFIREMSCRGSFASGGVTRSTLPLERPSSSRYTARYFYKSMPNFSAFFRLCKIISTIFQIFSRTYAFVCNIRRNFAELQERTPRQNFAKLHEI